MNFILSVLLMAFSSAAFGQPPQGAFEGKGIHVSNENYNHVVHLDLTGLGGTAAYKYFNLDVICTSKLDYISAAWTDGRESSCV